jgi:hypothetical protein
LAQIEEDYEQDNKKNKKQGKKQSSNTTTEAGEEDLATEAPVSELYCAVCRKKFKSQAQ